ncbi:hypothetical protein MPTK1_3g09740 [Marchantia polymorpha subsp. ruderalis]|uniref:Uncharacterized protein n=3 Tax=Marchantia polymorpha TaxID=3197 RepID=A0AAF6AZ49_MARPO|nr:hypothetical protein MARPO_0085s0054 [Marchantia polymorpha]BBN05033.1 hypothetical protein Mp_3g09740 [Marchantia polymorpha subsp. ruderalis]|eukprot:PTQ33842.1 hypothetical protein MARPO_0085s0054 [Marchantia polymorpha]
MPSWCCTFCNKLLMEEAQNGTAQMSTTSGDPTISHDQRISTSSEQSQAERAQGEHNESASSRAFHSAVVMAGAILYIADLISDILVLQVYWQELYIEGTFEGSGPGLGREITAFATALSFLIASQIFAIVLFKMSLPPEDYPVRSACILPLIQLYRLMREILGWTKEIMGGQRRVPRRWESSETESLFSIASAVEASLQLPIQVSYIVLIGFTDAHWQPSPVLVLSVVASLLSASFNAGMAIMYQSSLRWGFLLNAAGIAGGLYTLATVMLRSLSMASISVASEVSGIHHGKLLGVDIAITFTVFYCFGLISMGATTSFFTFGTQLRAGMTVMFFYLGPVYPMLHRFYQKTLSARLNTLSRLTSVALINLLLDVLTFSILAELKWGLCNYTRRRLRFPELPYLSSTLKCPQFLALTTIGAVLSAVTILALCFILFLSSVKDFHMIALRDSSSDFLDIITAELDVAIVADEGNPAKSAFSLMTTENFTQNASKSSSQLASSNSELDVSQGLVLRNCMPAAEGCDGIQIRRD